MKSLIYFFLVCATVCLFGCGKSLEKTTTDKAIEIIYDVHTKKSCMVDAAIFKAVYKADHALKEYYWSRMLIIIWNRPNSGIGGHVSCVFVVQDKLFSYDYSNGSQLVPNEFRFYPKLIAKYLYGNAVVKDAFFL